MAKSKFKSFVIKTGITVVILAVVIGALVGLKAIQIGEIMAAIPNMQPPPASVATANVRSMDWPVESNAIGTIAPVQGVTLSVESAGLVTDLAFESGQTVRKGDLLLQLDTRSEAAQLAAASAAADLAKISLDRAQQLLGRKTISQAEFDAADAGYKEAMANVANLEAIIEKKKIVAPFAGRLGIRRVNLGEYLTPGAQVVSLQSTDPIYANFYLPQRDLAYLKVGLEVETYTDAFPDLVKAGAVSAIAAEVDATTRMVEVQATLPNPQGQLAAGMFVNVRIARDAPRTVKAVPASAVIYASFGNSIYVVEPAEEGEGFIALQKFVRLGERRGDFIEVIEGLELGDRVVAAGGLKLMSGAPVLINDGTTPEAQLNPTPDDA
ncbi:efflux RND transporter periplasmic adaptor subunit [Coraliomargarita sp. SDUM461003]|uniref:Efflux RND transporter periplasmic adaptor subunit n=1 Tax=Thalassobacterium maritimum TaxID=3041265 RepID=A0ABU1AYC4_9BACT|nr:efflux RND transporter periplasmic adaptor subunit [Coraliomargarita sp. SDUM461003]MDQ8209142.1 efflux RND transporter periplasmic adaptor subunit [Coraliomargarita sp. SDUM461003]